MKKLAILVFTAVFGAASFAVAAPANAVMFAGTCEITLASSYVTNSRSEVITTIPNSAVSCPGFTFDPATDYLSAYLSNALGGGYAILSSETDSNFDPNTNSMVETHRLQLSAQANPSPYTKVAVLANGTYNTYYKVTHASQDYMVVLTAPFTVKKGFVTTNSCTLTVPPLKYTWGQDDHFVIPDSAMACTGFTWNSTDYSYYATFKSNNGSRIYLETKIHNVYDPATKTTTQKYQLSATLPYEPSALNEGPTLRCRCTLSNGSGVGEFGKFSELPAGSSTTSTAQAETYPGTPVTLAKPFFVKAATSIVATPKSIAGDPEKLSIHIQADRNQSFQNGDTPSYKRQTVIPKRNADHPTILRGGKEIKTVTLDKFGEATVTVKNPNGKQKFTIQMPKTATNFAGSTHFKK